MTASPTILAGRRYLAACEAAAVIGVHPATLRRWHLRGDGPPVAATHRGRPLYDADALASWLARREAMAAS